VKGIPFNGFWIDIAGDIEFPSMGVFGLGWREKIIPPEGAGFGFAYKAHSPVHIWDMCRWMQRRRRGQRQARWWNYFFPPALSVF
jgi:hypothetical protein